MTLRIDAERRKHPVYRYRTVYWGTVYRDNRPIFQIGPYRRRDDALQRAEQERVKIADKDATMTTEKTEAGQQYALPGAERREPDLLRQRAAAPLQAAKPQRPCDHGLFGDADKQIDLEDLLR